MYPPSYTGEIFITISTVAVHALTASHLHCTAGSSRSFSAIRKDAGLYCGSRLRSGEVFAYVGLSQNLEDLKCTPTNFVTDRGAERGDKATWIREFKLPWRKAGLLISMIKWTRTSRLSIKISDE